MENKCTLCQVNPATKTNSHIIPSFLVAMVASYDGSYARGKEIMFTIDPYKTRGYTGSIPSTEYERIFNYPELTEERIEQELSQNSVADDYIFCPTCEKDFATYLEGPYAEFSKMGKKIDASIPLLFWISVIWRMSVAGTFGFKLKSHQEEYLQYCINQYFKLKKEKQDVSSYLSKIGLGYKLLYCKEYSKNNVKLVGSIVPTDIDLEKVSSEGVKMLRSYIEFAQQGIVALEKELTFNYDLDFDSPFEEAVYDFLQSKGYNVVTQVGCSGFRIDMAVKHPTQSGKFAIGIECDGAAYHSSRTARERDRLRQAVLEDMGWTIYRIWSTDWIKDQKTEEEKLINAVEKALGRAIIESEDNDISDSSDSNADAVIPMIEIEEKIEPSEIADKGYGFDLYKRAYPLNIIDEDGNTREGYDIAWDIISLEQPIHFEELCRRIAPAYGRQKATSVVRDEIKHIFRYHLKGMITEDKNEFVRIKDFADVKVRVPNPDDDYLRPINYICNEELALAMKTIAQHSFGITPDDLFIVTAREFGFKRTGENIIYSLHKVYQQMLKKGEVTEVDGKVQVISRAV